MTYEQAEKKYYEYLEGGNDRQANKYNKIMREIEDKTNEEEYYYKTRVADLIEFIKNKGLYDNLQIFLDRKDKERYD